MLHTTEVMMVSGCGDGDGGGGCDGVGGGDVVVMVMLVPRIVHSLWTLG